MPYSKLQSLNLYMFFCLLDRGVRALRTFRFHSGCRKHRLQAPGRIILPVRHRRVQLEYRHEVRISFVFNVFMGNL